MGSRELFIYFLDNYRGNIKSFWGLKAIRYYKSNNQIKSVLLSTTSTKVNDIKQEIYDFFTEKYEEDNSYNTMNVNIQSLTNYGEFVSVPGYSALLKHVDKPYGYIYTLIIVF